MTQEEKIDKIYDVVIRVGPMVEDHHTTLYGNGQPGLSKEVALLKQRQEDCPARKATTAEGKRVNIACAAIVIAVVSCLINIVVSLFVK